MRGDSHDPTPVLHSWTALAAAAPRAMRLGKDADLGCKRASLCSSFATCDSVGLR